MVKSAGKSPEDRRSLSGALAGLVLLCIAGFLLAAYFKPPPPKAIDPHRIVDGVRRFWQVQKPTGNSVTFSELIARGYLPPQTLQDLGATEVTVYLNTTNISANPESFILDALMSDGTHQAISSDGVVLPSLPAVPTPPTNR